MRPIALKFPFLFTNSLAEKIIQALVLSDHNDTICTKHKRKKSSKNKPSVKTCSINHRIMTSFTSYQSVYRTDNVVDCKTKRKIKDDLQCVCVCDTSISFLALLIQNPGSKTSQLSRKENGSIFPNTNFTTPTASLSKFMSYFLI